MAQFSKDQIKQLLISEDQAGRRIDNYLISLLSDIPKSRVYQMLRKGEVRVNKGRIKQTYRLEEGDLIRLPPIYHRDIDTISPGEKLIESTLDAIIFEDKQFLIINKPAGVVVHSGSGQPNGIIEAIRAAKKEYEKVELVHRLDRDTSGCLILAKNMKTLRYFHQLMVTNGIKKQYSALLHGQIQKTKWTVDKPLKKQILQSGERVVKADEEGKSAITRFYLEEKYEAASLVKVELDTGRTHQIRVHSSILGHPVIGDEKYGLRDVNQYYKKLGLKRMFLHASLLRFKMPSSDKMMSFEAELPKELNQLINNLKK